MINETSKRGFFRSALQSMIESRERQAQRYVDRILLSLDDDAANAQTTGKRGALPFI